MRALRILQRALGSTKSQKIQEMFENEWRSSKLIHTNQTIEMIGSGAASCVMKNLSKIRFFL